MTSRDFCFWLQGFCELSDLTALDAEKMRIVRAHLALVFVHEIDPSIPGDPQALQEVHDAGKPYPTHHEGLLVRC